MIKTTKNLFEVLNTLFWEDLSINQIAGRTGISVMGASKIVKKLAAEKAVNVAKIGRSHVISLNIIESNLELFSLAERYRFEKFLAKHKALSGFLIKMNELKTDFSLVFGSYASGEESSDSDLDVMIVTSDKNIYKEVDKIKSLLSLELYPLIITRSEFIKQAKKKHRIYQEIIRGKRIMVHGEHNFWSLLLKLKHG